MFSRLFSFLVCGVAAVTVATAAPNTKSQKKGTPQGLFTASGAARVSPPKPKPLDTRQVVGYLLADNEVSVTQDLVVPRWDSSMKAPLSLLQEAEGLQPHYDAKGLQKKPAIVFDGVMDVMLGVVPELRGNQRTMTLVMQVNKLPVKLTTLLLLNGTEGLALKADGGLRAIMPQDPDLPVEVVETEPLKGACIVTLCMGDGATQIFVNGTRMGLAEVNNANPEMPLNSLVQLGCDGFNGAVAAAVILNRMLPPIERRALEMTFSKKFNIPLGEESPLPYRKPRMGKIINGKI